MKVIIQQELITMHRVDIHTKNNCFNGLILSSEKV